MSEHENVGWLGVLRDTIASLETGLDTQERICDILGVRRKTWLGYKEPFSLACAGRPNPSAASAGQRQGLFVYQKENQ